MIDPVSLRRGESQSADDPPVEQRLLGEISETLSSALQLSESGAGLLEESSGLEGDVVECLE